MKTDLNKLAELAKNNQKAFTELYDLIYPIIYSYCYMKTGNQHISEDIVSAVFEVILTNLTEFNPELSTFKTWILSITNHKLIDYWRKANNHSSSITEFENSNDLVIDSSDENDKALLLQQIYSSLKKLSDTEAEIIRLKYYANLSKTEIGEFLSISENSVPALATRALKKLTKLIN